MSEIKKLTCIVCPQGCSLCVETETGVVSGNRCKRGESYGRNEITNPTRVLTTTVRLEDSEMLPVRTAAAIPKPLLFEAMKRINQLQVRKPIHSGEILIADLLGTGVPVIATKSIY